MRKLLTKALVGIICVSMTMQGIAVLPALAEENGGTPTYADVLKKAGNDEMKKYGTAVENGTETPQVNAETVPEAGAGGTTYYVDPDGNDEQNGTTPDTAWQSVEKVNAQTFQPGDRILFKAGGEWKAPEPSEVGAFDDDDNDDRPEEFLAPKGSGTADAYIVLGAYSTGALPKLTGDSNVNSVISLKDQEYWDISNLDVSNFTDGFDPKNTGNAANAEKMGNLRGIQIYGQSHTDDNGVLDGYKLHDLYVHDVSGYVYWGGSPATRGYYGVAGMMGNDASKRTGGIVFEVWKPTTENDLSLEEKQANDKDRPITFNDIHIYNNVICDTSFGGITVKQWSGSGHEAVNTAQGFHSDKVEATNEMWHRRIDASNSVDTNKPTAENGYTYAGFHPHTNVYINDNYVSNNNTEYGCNTIRVQSVAGGLVQNNVCAGSGTCAIELDYLDDVVVQYNEVYDTKKKMGGADNNAIDTDAETTNCLIQYNYVHENGDGFLLCGIEFSTAVYRYNIIKNSGSGDHYIAVYGDSGENSIHNNLVYTSNNATSLVGVPGSKAIDKQSNPVYFDNNIFLNASLGSRAPSMYQGNYSFYSNNSFYGSKRNIPKAPKSDTKAITEEIKFSGDFEDDLAALTLTAQSPLINSGTDAKEHYPKGFGTTKFVREYLSNEDFFGNDTPSGSAYDIGVHEYQFTAGKGILRGYVYDEYDNPAENVTVTIDGTDTSVTTNTNGYYSFGEVDAGSYQIKAAKEDYLDSDLSEAIAVTAGEVSEMDLTLGECQLDVGIIKGTVTGGGEPVEEVKVALILGGEQIDVTSTEADGSYNFQTAEGEGYSITVTKDGFKDKTEENIKVQKGVQTEKDVTLKSSDYSSTSYFIDESFNGYTTGTFENNAVWTTYGKDKTDKLKIVDDEDNEGNKYLLITKSNSQQDDTGIFNQIDANLGGIVAFEARVMRTSDGSGTQANQFGIYTFNNNTTDWQNGGSSKNAIATVAFARDNEDREIFTHFWDDAAESVGTENLTEYELNKWYTLRCVANLDTKTYDFYIDDMDTPVVSGAKLRNQEQNTIDKFMIYSGGGNQGTLLIDYFRVSSGAPYDHDDAALSGVTVNGSPATKVTGENVYEVKTAYDAKKLIIVPKPQSIFASVSANGSEITSDGIEVAFTGDELEKEFEVTAEDGETTKTYTLKITRATENEDEYASLNSVSVNGTKAAKIEGENEYEITLDAPENGKVSVLPDPVDGFYAQVKVGDEICENGGGNIQPVEVDINTNRLEIPITVTGNGSGVVKIYNLVIKTTTPPENWIVNGDFEDEDNVVKPNSFDWTVDNYVGKWEYVNSSYATDEHNDGTHSIHLGDTGNGYLAQHGSKRFTAGKTYILEAYVKGSGSVQLRIENGGVTNPDSAANQKKTGTFSVTDADVWKKVTLEYTNAEAVTPVIMIYAASGQTIYIDSVSLTEKPESAVKLNANGGVIVEGDITSYIPSTEVTLPTDVTKDGAAFLGWYDNISCEGEAVVEIPADAEGDLRYYAKWKLNTPAADEIEIDYINEKLTGFLESTAYEISGDDVETTVISGVTEYSASDYAGKTLSIKKKAVVGYEADSGAIQMTLGGRITPDPTAADVAITDPTTVGGSGTITAKIDYLEYKVGNGAWSDLNTTDAVDVSGGATVLIRKKADGASLFASNPLTVNIKNRYSITYFVNGGNINPTPASSYLDGEGVTLPTKDDITRYGYVFEGWYTDDSFTEGNKVTAIAVGENGNKTFYANWKQYLKPVSDNVTIEKVTNDNGINLIVTSSQGEMQTINLYEAIYKNDGTLKEVKMTTYNKGQDGTIIVQLTEPHPENDESYKILLWDTEQSPLITPIISSDNFFN